MTNKSLEELEVKVAFLEDSLNKMSDEFFLQQRELDALKAKYAGIVDKFRKLQSDQGVASQSPDERPPHY